MAKDGKTRRSILQLIHYTFITECQSTQSCLFTQAISKYMKSLEAQKRGKKNNVSKMGELKQQKISMINFTLFSNIEMS